MKEKIKIVLKNDKNEQLNVAALRTKKLLKNYGFKVKIRYNPEFASGIISVKGKDPGIIHATMMIFNGLLVLGKYSPENKEQKKVKVKKKDDKIIITGMEIPIPPNDFTTITIN